MSTSGFWGVCDRCGRSRVLTASGALLLHALCAPCRRDVEVRIAELEEQGIDDRNLDQYAALQEWVGIPREMRKEG